MFSNIISTITQKPMTRLPRAATTTLVAIGVAPVGTRSCARF